MRAISLICKTFLPTFTLTNHILNKTSRTSHYTTTTTHRHNFYIQVIQISLPDSRLLLRTLWRFTVKQLVKAKKIPRILFIK